MKCFTRIFSAVIATLALTAGSASASDALANGKIKSVDASAKTFVLTDTSDKDHSFKFGDDMLVNRAGKVGMDGIKTGDTVNVCYDKGTFTWTAHYVLIQDGKSKNCELVHGLVKSYDADKQELIFTNEADKKDLTFVTTKAKVCLNREPTKIDIAKVGDYALLIVKNVDGKSTLEEVMISRATK
jgi:hypothetical protein